MAVLATIAVLSVLFTYSLAYTIHETGYVTTFPDLIQISVSVTHKMNSALSCAVSCASDHSCVFFSVGGRKAWMKVLKDPDVSSDVHEKPSATKSAKEDKVNNRKVRNKMTFEHRPWKICDDNPENEKTCDLATNSWPRRDCIVRRKVWTYSNIKNLNAALPRKLEDLSQIRIRGIIMYRTNRRKISVHLISSNDRRFFMDLHIGISTSLYSYRKRGGEKPYRRMKLRKGSPFLLTITVHKEKYKLYLSSGGRKLMSMGVDGDVLIGIDRIKVPASSKKIEIAVESWKEGKMFVFHGCAFPNNPPMTNMSVRLPVRMNKISLISMKGTLTQDLKQLILYPQNSLLSQHQTKLTLAEQKLNLEVNDELWYQTPAYSVNKLRPFLLNISTSNDELKYEVSGGVHGSPRMKIRGLLGGVDKIKIQIPGPLTELIIHPRTG